MLVKNKNIHSRPVMPMANPQFELLKSDGFHLWVKNKQGKEIKLINWSTGIAVEAFGGKNRKAIVKKVNNQLKTLSHSSLTYETDLHLKAAEKLLNQFDPKGGVVFCLDGLGANERMLKAFYYYHEKKNDMARRKIIVFNGAFHGRSFMEVSATNKYDPGLKILKDHFEQLFIRLPFNDVKALEAACSKEVAGIIYEPLQGEGGVTPVTEGFTKAIFENAKKHGILVACDEVQCGIGRTGKLFCYENFGMKPHMLSLAKALGGGIQPVGAILYNEEVRRTITDNEQHLYNEGSTFSAMPPAMVAVLETLKLIEKTDITRTSSYLRKELEKVKQEFPAIIEDIRGIGFLIGLKLNAKYDPEDISNLLKENGLSTHKAGGNVLRVLPPLDINRKLIDSGITILRAIFSTLK